MKTRLKHFRVMSFKTQSEAAKTAGVTQPSYQRWEAGKAEIPQAALKKLAKLFETTPDELLGIAPRLRAALYDNSAPEQCQYFGEVAVHFKGRGKPLVLSISEAARDKAYSELQEKRQFITFADLGNRTVAIRREAIDEFYFSSEAYDTYGPDHHTEEGYDLLTPIQLPDPRDWETIEAIHWDLEGAVPLEFEEETPEAEEIKRIEGMIMINNEQFDKYVAEGIIKSEDLESEKAARAKETAAIFKAATKVTVRFSSGKQRDIGYFDCNLYERFEQFEDEHYPYGDDDMATGMICLPWEGYHRTMFVNAQTLDYITFPSHKLAKDEVESLDEGIIDRPESSETTGRGRVIKLAKAKAKKRNSKNAD